MIAHPLCMATAIEACEGKIPVYSIDDLPAPAQVDGTRIINFKTLRVSLYLYISISLYLYRLICVLPLSGPLQS